MVHTLNGNLLRMTVVICRRAPALFQKDADHLLRLFRVFSESGGPVDREVGLAVQECVSLLAPAYQGVAPQKALLLEAALLENIYSVRPVVGEIELRNGFKQNLLFATEPLICTHVR